jgi:hypothetical protein
MLYALHGIHDFIYLAQYKVHSEKTLDYMKKALHQFHQHKQQFIEHNACRGKSHTMKHFKIPKLYALLTFTAHIRSMGTLPQFSTEITESCHQTMAKQAYRATNKRDFEKQMCGYLDRCDRVSFMKELLHWWKIQENCDAVEEAIRDQPSDYQTLARALLLDDTDEEMLQATGSQGREHIWHNVNPHNSKRSLEQICNIYCLPNFLRDLNDYLVSLKASAWPISENVVDTWLNCRIQLPLIQEEDEQAAVRTIQALPPSASLPYGRCSCVLIRTGQSARSTGLKGLYFHFHDFLLLNLCRVSCSAGLHDLPSQVDSTTSSSYEAFGICLLVLGTSKRTRPVVIPS